MGLPLPNATELRDLAHKALAEWPADTEAALRMVCTRGGEDGGSPTVYVTVAPVSEATKRARREGISIITASLGMRFDARSTAPWLLGGAKTLSYAVNMASLRFATGQGVDDVLWVSSDGYALEAPTSTLLWLSGGTVWTVPADLTGILAGTTARWLLAQVDSIGLTAGERLVRPDELAEADGIWLTSSIRGLAEVRGLDGASRKPSPYTEELSNLLGHPR
jgi:4-amino-4-deoxychorismate lyase